jgi:hypothetical protein
MKLALIPPVGWENYLVEGTMGMALAQVSDGGYRQAFRKLQQSGRHVILDNGAAEGAYILGRDLFRIAAEVSADEIVMPDVPTDAVETRKAVAQFLRHNEHRAQDYFFMAVVQGTTMDELKRIVEYYLTLPHVSVLGLPRNLLRATGNTSIRLELATWIETETRSLPIHLLGSSRVHPEEVKWVARYAPFVRSVDTSAPFVFAIHGKSIDCKQVVDRPEWYLKGGTESFNSALVKHNLHVLKNWVKPDGPS